MLRRVARILSARPMAGAAAALFLLLMPAALSAQAQAPDTHTVKKGDTLWDIARQYLGDPVLWPQIYRLNTDVVEDPHWIFPGEVLKLKATAGPVSAVPAEAPPVQAAPVPVPVEAQPAPAQETAQMPVEPTPQAEAPPADTTAVVVLQEPPPEQVAPVSRSVAESAYSQPLSSLFGRVRTQEVDAELNAYTEQNYHPLRRSEVYSAGFLTEKQPLAYGDFLGPVQPSQIASQTNTPTALLYATVAVRPPAGATYQVGDTLLVVTTQQAAEGGYGDVVIPTGLVRLTDVSRAENVGVVVAVYGNVQRNEYVLPLEPFNDPGRVRPVPVSDGITAHVIQSRDGQVLKGVGDVLFLDKGRAEGVAPGDLFEAVRAVEVHDGGAATIPEAIGTLQVVHVRDHTATVRILMESSSDIGPGVQAIQRAKLPT